MIGMSGKSNAEDGQRPPISDALLDEFATQIKMCTIQTVSKRPIIRLDRLKSWLSTPLNQTGRDVFGELVDLAKVSYQFDKDDETLMVLFCLLLHLNMVGCFDKFLAAGVRSVPASMAELDPLRDYLGSKGVSDFFNAQWSFCPVTLELDEYYEWAQEVVVPIYQQHLIGRGQTASVYAVVIQQSFIGPKLRLISEKFRFNNENLQGEPFYRFAMKTFNRTYLASGKNETVVSQKANTEDCVVRYLSTFTSFEQRLLQSSTPDKGTQPQWTLTYNILFEYGQANLRQFFHSITPPASYSAIRSFWEQIIRISKAIERLHLGYSNSKSTSGQPEEYFGYHHDLKPSNVIIVDGDFKLGDFGFASVGRRDQVSTTTYSYAGTLSYGPPETNTISQSSVVALQAPDIWSLGCILSEAATWVVLGAEGLKRFRKVRRDALEKLYQTQLRGQEKRENSKLERGDYFHNGYDTLSDVHDWHASLKTCTRRSDFITKDILDLVDGRLLLGDLNKRASATETYSALLKILENDLVEGTGKAHHEIPIVTWQDEFKQRVDSGLYEIA